MSIAEFRIFTVPEAERALPLVRRIMTDLLAAHTAWREAVRRLESGAGAAGDGPDDPADRVLATALEVERHLAELREVGCVFKGFDGGMVDFYTLRDDRPVFLCWRMGEPHLGHWHEVDGGFAGRQPLDDHLLHGTVS